MDINNKKDIIYRELIIENNILMDNMEKIKSENTKYKECNKRLTEDNKKLQEELDKITYSRIYKLIKMLKKIIRRR